MANVIQINGKKVKDINAVRMASLAPVEASTTATVQHAVGTLFWLDGTLHEATAAIAVGDTITVGTNCKVADMNNMPHPDWNQSDSSANDFIKNKPSIRQQANGGILENAATSASGQNSHAEGGGTTASGAYSHSEGGGTTSSGQGSHAEGSGAEATGNYSHAEGGGTKAIGEYSHAEGAGAKAIGAGAHAEGSGTTASSSSSHAEGESTTASGGGAHSEGGGTTASGNASHAEGGSTTASGRSSHAEGGDTIASGDYSHAEGSNTTANHMAQHVFGMHNVPDSSAESSGAKGNYVEIVGNGLDTNRRSNARTLDWEGNQEVAGDVIAYGCGGANPISLADLKSQITSCPIESGTGVGSAKTKDFTFDNIDGMQNAIGAGSLAEGINTMAYGNYSHAEGSSSHAIGQNSHAEGSSTAAVGKGSHAEGGNNLLQGTISGAANATTYTLVGVSMQNIKINDPIVVFETNQTSTITAIDILNNTVTVSKSFVQALNGQHIIIFRGYANGSTSHCEGLRTTTYGNYSHAEGNLTIAIGDGSHVEGISGKAIGEASHAEGTSTMSVGENSHAENNCTLSYGTNSHAENKGILIKIPTTGDANATTYAYTGNTDPAVGDVVNRQQYYCRVVSVDTVNKTFTVDNTLHYQLSATSLSFYRSGAFGENSHVEGLGTTALSSEQHVQGKYNVLDADGTYAEIVGNGTAHDARSNARTLDWSGNEELAGSITLGKGTADEVTLTAAQLKQLLALLN